MTEFNHRVHNFCAGPAALPESVLLRAQSELLNFRNSGSSIMEMSHRGSIFMAIAAEAEARLRLLLSIPDNYKVLFLQGGAHLQFAMIPMNLMLKDQPMAFADTGYWSRRAIKEAALLGNVITVTSSKNNADTAIPEFNTWNIPDQASFLHYTPNETIHGIEFDWIPDAGDIPLVADLSSSILSQPLDVSKFGLIYAGAQKNIGPAGLTLVIIRDDLVARAPKNIPGYLNYATQVEQGSMYNTPATFAWYLANMVFEWLLNLGGLSAIAKINQQKAELLYKCIDDSDLYSNPVRRQNRSRMNVPFILKDPNLDKVFLMESEKNGLLNLKGHRAVGGMRASLYNAVGIDSVKALTDFMREFEKKHG
ncbi:MAG: 3-phosphoserine/phosphohydroxythreonine transaminase [Pseudomonadota bacterium]